MRAEAAAWLARLRADDKGPADERAFRAWLAADTSHVAAFEEVTEAWETAGALRRERIAEPAPTASVLTRRGAVLAGATALAAAGAFFAFRQRAYAETYGTSVGEQKHVVLSDGTQAFLDTDTRICVRFANDMRVVDFDRGRCDFHLTQKDTRPFIVNASAQLVVAGLAAFEVQRDGADLAVVVTKGSAAVTGGRGLTQDPCLVRAGERLQIGPGGSAIDRPNLAHVLAWRNGQAVFENDTLGAAIHEMNRYSLEKLEAADTAVARMRISGVYHVGDNVAFARSVAALLPVVVVMQGERLRLALDPARANNNTEEKT